jgi:ketosteroid isomerase-like protein
VRRLFERWARGDVATAEFFDTDVEFVRHGGSGAFAGLGGEWRGLDQMWAAVREYLQAWEDLRTVAERFVELGDRVLILARQTGRGRSSGVAVDHEVAFLATVRRGKIVRLEAYWDRDRALADLGLAPEGEAGRCHGKTWNWSRPCSRRPAPTSLRSPETRTPSRGGAKPLASSLRRTTRASPYGPVRLRRIPVWKARANCGSTGSSRGPHTGPRSTRCSTPGNRVIVLLRDHGRRKDMDAEVELIGAALLTITDGKVTRIEHHAERKRALADLGLAPEGDATL